MGIYTSRFSNPELRKGCYTVVRVSLGTPKWDLGYRIDGELKDLMPFGLLGKYDNDMEGFRREYYARLDRVGVTRILQQIQRFGPSDHDIVLVCYEDIRKPENWCHRTMFAEWWRERTGEVIEELTDPSKGAAPKTSKSSSKPDTEQGIQSPPPEQLSFI